MKQSFLILFVILIFMTSCENKKPNSSKTIKPRVENEFHYVEFVDSNNSFLSQKTISLVKSRIFNKGYIFTEETNDWQGIKEIDTTEQVQLKDLIKPHQSIHRFRDYSEYGSDHTDAEKIVITYNNLLNDSIPNFNFRSYKKRGHPDWQSFFNPGNFRFNATGKFTEKELADWMVKHIVGLTFK